MKNEVSLSAAVDDLARRRAEDFILDVEKSVKAALDGKWRSKKNSDYFRGPDIRAVLASLANPDECARPKPTPGLINSFRAEIIDGILSGLPMIKELVRMQDEAGATEGSE